jgi:hypothetical protein
MWKRRVEQLWRQEACDVFHSTAGDCFCWGSVPTKPKATWSLEPLNHILQLADAFIHGFKPTAS